ncbi:MAG: transposase [Kouleothrix sp.]|nr:transposase [Kouleothrix sp.]MBK9945149.1 transposase [Kouleothrix sp.]
MTATPTPPTYQLFAGVDIAAASFAASWSRGSASRERAHSFAQSPDGFAAFHAALAATGVDPAATLIVLEATGSYWISLAVYLHQAGYAVSIVNPAHAHAFAHSLPRRAKTDSSMPNCSPSSPPSASRPAGRRPSRSITSSASACWCAMGC